VTLAFCWAHLRRRFYERAVADASPIANEALQRIATLCKMFCRMRGLVVISAANRECGVPYCL
jgi:hypothetical protein